MSSLNDLCKEIMGNVDGALACGVVDVNTGLLLGVAHSVPCFTQSYLDDVAAAATDMVRRKTVKAVESLLSTQRGKKMENSIKEVLMTTDATYHFMAIIPQKPNCLVVLITSKKVNMGMGTEQNLSPSRRRRAFERAHSRFTVSPSKTCSHPKPHTVSKPALGMAGSRGPESV